MTPAQISEYQSITKRICQLVRDNGEERYTRHICTPERAADYLKYADFVAEHVPIRHSKVLDWGALYGHVSVLLQILGAEVVPYMIRPSQASSAALTSNFPGWIQGSDCSLLPFPDATFDVVISSGTLEHVDDFGGNEAASISEIFRILRPSGKFIIWKLPLASSLSEILGDVRGSWTHEVRYTEPGIRLKLQNHGFEVKVVNYDSFLPGGVRAVLRKLHLGILIRISEWLSRRRPFKALANDLLVLAEKPAFSENRKANS